MKTTKNLNIWLAMSMFLLLMACGTAAGRTIYVDADGKATEKGTFVVINQAVLRESLGEGYDSVLDACKVLVEAKDTRILDAGRAYQKQFGKPLRVDHYPVFFRPPGEATKKARWLQDWLSHRVSLGSTVVLLGDEKSLPTWQVNLVKLKFTTDSLYCDLDGDGVPETAVSRILGTADMMIRQLQGKKDYGPKAVILCSEDTRIHLETRAFAKSLSQLGYDVAICGTQDDEILANSDFIIHFGHGRPSHIFNRFGETFVSASAIPTLPRSPIVFMHGCETLSAGSPLLHSFLKQGALAYVGSTAAVLGMIPARFTNELVEHFLRLHAERPQSPIIRLLIDARAAYVQGHSGLSDRLRELAATGKVSISGNENHLLTVAEWVYYGDPKAVMPRVGLPKKISRQAYSLAKPICLDKTNKSWQTSFEARASDGQAIFALYIEVPISDRDNFNISVRQNDKELSFLDSRRQDTRYQRIGRDCRGGYICRDTYRARFLLPLFEGQGEQKLEVWLIKGTSVVLTPGTEVDVWPLDFEEKIGLRQEPVVQKKTAAIPKLSIPNENLQIPDEMQTCRANFQKIHTAIRVYRKDKGMPAYWLSDLIPDYLSNETLFCPNDSEHNSPYLPDPNLPCSYSYEFSSALVRYRNRRIQQVMRFGMVVPIVRCHHHGDNRLNLSVGGQIYWSPLIWERMFMTFTQVRKKEPVKAVGVAKLRPTDVAGFHSLDLSGFFNRPHNSVLVGGGDNASFKTWFSEDKVTANDVPFLVRRVGNDVVVSENNTQNVYEIKGIKASARALHFLIWGYMNPRAPARLQIAFSDGSSQECELPLSEWTQAVPPVAFDFKNTIANFKHAAITHRVVNIAHREKKIVSIISTSGTYGLVAITLEED